RARRSRLRARRLPARRAARDRGHRVRDDGRPGRRRDRRAFRLRPMRHLLAFSGWSNLDLPRGAWLWADTMGRPVTLAHALGKEEALEVGSNEQRTVHAVVAGSIYNARQLRTSLAGRHAPSGRDDAEVVGHL